MVIEIMEVIAKLAPNFSPGGGTSGNYYYKSIPYKYLRGI
jgi:hypothetical protein